MKKLIILIIFMIFSVQDMAFSCPVGYDEVILYCDKQTGKCQTTCIAKPNPNPRPNIPDKKCYTIPNVGTVCIP